MQQVIELVNRPLKLHPVKKTAEAEGLFGVIDLLDLHNLNPEEIVLGKVSAACGRAAMEYIAEAAHLALEGKVKAIATAPINKEATVQAGYGEMGHLEFPARVTHTVEYATMLVSGRLRVVHLTTHHSLRQNCSLVTKERIFGRLKLTQDSFRRGG